jgi:DNA processing protein
VLLQTADPPLLLYVQATPRCWRAAAWPSSAAATPARRAWTTHAPSPRASGRDGWRWSPAWPWASTAPRTKARWPAGRHRGGGRHRPGPRLPGRHRALARRIAERGLVVSEYAPGTPPLPPNFPQRNRIIAGLARARWWWRRRCARAR